MAHRLDPPEGTPYLDPSEVVGLLRREFAVVVGDAAEGTLQAGNMVRQLERMGVPQAVIAEHRELTPHALLVWVAARRSPGTLTCRSWRFQGAGRW